MANLQSGTRIYGTANVDTQIYVATGNAVINATGFFINNFVMASNTYVQTLTPGSAYVSNNYYNVYVPTSNAYTQQTYVQKLQPVFTGNATFTTGLGPIGIIANGSIGLAGQVLVSNSTGIYWDSNTVPSNTYATSTYVSNNYFTTAVGGVSNSYATATYTSNNYATTAYASNNYITSTYVSNNFANDPTVGYVSNNYFKTYVPVSNSYATSSFASNNYLNNSLVPVSNAYAKDATVGFVSNSYYGSYVHVSNAYVSSATGLASNTYLAATFASNAYANAFLTSNSYATSTYVSNNYYSTSVVGVSNSYATSSFASNNYLNNVYIPVSNSYLNTGYIPVSNSYFRAYPQTMTVAMSNEQSNLVASSTLPAAVVRLPYACTLISPYIRLGVTNAPVGSSVTADIRLTGTGTIISGGAVSIATGSNTSSASIPTMTTTSFSDDAQLQFYITAVGSTTAGSGLKATLYYIRST